MSRVDVHQPRITKSRTIDIILERQLGATLWHNRLLLTVRIDDAIDLAGSLFRPVELSNGAG